MSAIPDRRSPQQRMMGVGGNCFEVALHLATAIVNEGGAPLVRIAHGRPIGRGVSNRGRRFWHAWLEFKGPRGWLVLDYSNGLETEMRRAEYYRQGQIEPDQVLRFDMGQAAAAITEYGHAGPWSPDWDSGP